MAGYVPTQLVAPTALSNAIADGTWNYTPSGATKGIIRQMEFLAQAGGKTITADIAPATNTAADAGLDLYGGAFALMANVPEHWRGWKVVVNGAYLRAACAVTPVNGSADGYEWS